MSKKNRRTLLFILLVYCVGTSLKGHAQILIPQVGVTFAKSNLASKDVSPYGSDVSFKTGLVAGMGIEFSLSKRWALNSGLFYIQKGSMSHHEIHEGSMTWINQLTFSHEYIDLPVTAKLKFGTSSAFYCTLGADISYWIGGSYKWYFSYASHNGGPPATGSGEVQMKGDGAQILIPISRPSYNSRYDVGLRAGVGVLINKRVNFDVAYIHGFTEIGYYYDRVVAANRVIQLSVGMPLKISRD